MRHLAIAAAAALAFALPAAAQDKQPADKKELTPQQQRMQACNADAKKRDFKDNDARQAFMSSCLKGESAEALTPQQQRMKDCNAEAGKQSFKAASGRRS